MATFNETLERISAEAATPAAMFGGDGQRAPSRRREVQRGYQAKLAKAAQFVGEVYSGRRSGTQFAEAMSTDDFPVLFGDILDRQVLATYRQVFPSWEAVAKRRTVRDFRGAKLLTPLTGAEGRLATVGQLDEYPAESLSDTTESTLTVAKYGRRMAFSWEDFVNDDLDMFRDAPDRLGRAARRTESYLSTELYVDASGPHATLYSTANANRVHSENYGTADNPPLSIEALAQGLTIFGKMTNEDGEPIEHELVTLVVPPALEVTANNILNATALELTVAGGVTDGSGAEQRLLAANWMRNRLRLVVNPLIPHVATTANGDTSWFLFANPNQDREALTMVFLRGFEEPSIYIKTPNARRVGGGDVDPMDGDFDTDGVQYKVRHVVGAARVDPKATIASNGSGS